MNGNMSPASMTATIKALGIKGNLWGIPKGTANVFARGCIHTPARLRLQSAWARVTAISPCRAIFCKINDTGPNIFSTTKMLQFRGDVDSKGNVRRYFNCAVDFMIVSADLRIDIAIYRGRDKTRYGDNDGRAFVDFAGHTFPNVGMTDNPLNNMRVHKNCPIE